MIKNLLIDCLNGFPVDQIPLFLFQILCAGFLGVMMQFLINKKMGAKLVEHGALIALSIAVMTSIVKYSLPFAVIGAAAILLFLKAKDLGRVELISMILIAVAGVGCGVGSVIQTVLGFLVISCVILLTPLKK